MWSSQQPYEAGTLVISHFMDGETEAQRVYVGNSPKAAYLACASVFLIICIRIIVCVSDL